MTNTLLAPWWADEFPLRPGLAYLNHAAVAPWPRRTGEALERFIRENVSQGATAYPRWVDVEHALREQLAQLLNAPSAEDIALLKNTSEALSVVAHGLDWLPGDNVVISNEEFPSNRIVWESLQPQGVAVHMADLWMDIGPEAALMRQCDARTRLLAISSIEYASGLRLDLKRLGAFCRANNILFCVDAIQSLGAVNIDVQEIAADFVMADGHKWMLGPEGIAVFYCAEQHRERLRLRQFGWHMVENHLDFSAVEWSPARSARRFECGSPNMLGIHALHASLSLLLEVGISEVERLVQNRAAYLLRRLEALDQLEIITPLAPERHGGIVTFRHRSKESTEMHWVLCAADVVCAQRGGGIRFSPHFHTTDDQLDQACNVLATLS